MFLFKRKKEPKLKKSSPESKSAPDLHYIWVGSPGRVKGHDIGGPIKMAEKNKVNPIRFWCLDQYIDHYKNVYKDFPNIKVESIENYINLKKYKPRKTPQTAQDKMQKIFVDTLLAEGRGEKNIDKVKVKDAFSLYLMHNLGGYFLDTNILPLLGEEKLSFPVRDKFCVPAMSKRIDSRSDLECWMLYSPGPQNKEAKEFVFSYYDTWEQHEILRKTLLKEKRTLELFHDKISYAIIGPIFRSYFNGQIGLFETNRDSPGSFVDIPSCGIRKTYNNTHVFYKPIDSTRIGDPAQPEIIGPIPDIYYYIANNNLPALIVYLEFGGDTEINQVISPGRKGFLIGETPLCCALRSKSEPEIIIRLLQAGASPDVEVFYEKEGSLKRFNMRNLIEKNHEYSQVLQEFEKQNTPKKF